MVGILIFVAVPAAANDTDPHATPGPASHGLVVVAALHFIVAGLLLWKTRKSGFQATAGVFGLILGLLLTIASAFATHGAAMHWAAVALYGCAVADFIVGACGLTAALVRGTAELNSEHAAILGIR